MSLRRSRKTAYIATFGALAGILSFLPAFPGATALLGFPILSYLLIDPAEIFDFLAFFVGGPIVAVPTALIHCMVLAIAAVFTGNWLNFAGAFVKLAAVLSSFLGMSVGLRLYERAIGQGGKLSRMVKSSFASAAVFRVLILIPINIIFILTVTPLFFGSLNGFLYCKIYCPASLLNTVGIHTFGFWDLMGWILLITSIYNLVQLAIVAIPSYVLLFYTLRINLFQGQIYSGRVWIASQFKANSVVPSPKAKG